MNPTEKYIGHSFTGFRSLCTLPVCIPDYLAAPPAPAQAAACFCLLRPALHLPAADQSNQHPT